MAMMRAAVLCALLLGSASEARAHPLHNTITELTEDRSRGTIRAVIKVFADDFGTVLSRGPLAALTRERAVMSYLGATFVITDRSGRRLPLRPCGTKEAAGVVVICVEADSREGLATLRLQAAVLTDLYDDQINLVQATIAGARKSFLFMRGANARPLA